MVQARTYTRGYCQISRLFALHPNLISNIQGVQTQQDEDSFGTQGRTSRVRQETQQKVSQGRSFGYLPILLRTFKIWTVKRGTSAVGLYLEAYQFILQGQCQALINTVGLPEDLESVVKDLWSLRLQLLDTNTNATSDDETVFSSQPLSETEEVEKVEAGKREYKIRGKAMPTLIETLALLYLGTVLLRLPISMGDMHRYSRELPDLIRPCAYTASAGPFEKTSPSLELYALCQQLRSRSYLPSTFWLLIRQYVSASAT